MLKFCKLYYTSQIRNYQIIASFIQILSDVKYWRENDTILAKAIFENKQHSTGWMLLHIETKDSVEDDNQAYAAGLLEGYLTG